ncbi:MAG: tRNA pseudouridine(55) synthase TruB [Desulfobacter sp.]|nr:tRNA pseudouridine(55) synthase TruB [Desulfobacter sp.]WDP84601.1 MAG: tRNA pseudouridine(55) synthase TruB [Desulfobacter sp.]
MKDGILVVNKPEGLSSAGVVGRLKRILGVKKIGHTGTLDPFATGVLLIAVQKATRISRFFLDGSKTYHARITLGAETDTYDCTGKVTAQVDPSLLAEINFDTIQQVVSGFFGAQEQVAPAYSALKHKGQPLYKLARQGKMIQKPPRPVEIYKIRAEKLEQTSGGLPVFDLDVACSGGTYIRSLAYDIGRRLGCGAHLSGLCRTRSSHFRIEDAIDLPCLETMERSDINSRIVSMSDCLYFLPVIEADDEMAGKIKFGQKLSFDQVRSESGDSAPYIRVVDVNGTLLAVVQPETSGRSYKYCCVFSS